MLLATSNTVSLSERKEQTGTLNVLFWTLFFAGLFMFMPDMAMATDPIGNAVCKVVSTLSGKTAKAIATIGVIVLGFGALFGKISWGMAIMVTIGIVLIFGVTEILGFVYSGAGACGEG